MEVDVSQTTSGGNYIVETVVSTPFADYVVPSKLTVNRIERIPFSGNIPLSILVLIFAGIITYGIMIYVVTHKFDRGYVEIGLLSVGFGLLNWAIAYSINLVNIPERIYYEPLAIAILLGISALMGVGLGYLVKFIQAIRDWRTRSKQRSSVEKDFMRKGYAIDEEKAWATYVTDEWDDIKKSYGKRYSLVLRIHLKSSLNNIPFVEGILLRLELEPPYDIILEPKYVVSCANRRLLFVILTDRNAPILLDTLKTDKKYRKKLNNYLIEKYHVTSINSKYDPVDVYNEVVTQFTNRIMTDDFFSLLDAIEGLSLNDTAVPLNG